ncbi:MAG: 16S rRNA (uracil(1498)-N(3))-methyltransferase [Nannocystaceae bacterium]
MNLILLRPTDFVGDGRVILRDRRLRHVREIHRAELGDTLRVGVVDGLVGEGRVLAVGPEALELAVTLDAPPPPPPPWTLVLALPRPPSLRKVLQQATAIGVKRFVLVGAARVERSYWSSSALRPEAIEEELHLGLEQARDTAVPAVESWPRLHVFLRERWPALHGEGASLLADPGPEVTCPSGQVGPMTLVVGPEGGFIPDEVEAFRGHGCRAVSLGPRILRVETAVVALLGRLLG